MFILIMWKLLTVLFLAAFTNCNLWDKILNNDESVPTIKVDTDLHTQFQITRNGHNFDVVFDYDIKSEVATMRILSEVQLLILDTRVEVFEIQSDFKSGIFIHRTPLGCQNYELWRPTQNLVTIDAVTVEHYANMVFEYKRSAGDMYEFEFNPQYRGKLDQRTLDMIPKFSIVVDKEGRIIELISEGKTVPVIGQSKIPRDYCDGPAKKPEFSTLVRIARDLSIFSP